MAQKEEALEVEGVVTQALANTRFRVKIEGGHEVIAHVASSIVADKLPAICGSDTFTTVVSSTSIKVPSMTAIATIHGLMWGIACEFCLVSGRESLLIYLPVRTVGVTDIPGRNWRPGSCPGSKKIFTGTRCTTFT